MVQNHAVRRVMDNYSPLSSVTEMLENLGWRTLEQRRLDSRIVLFYKIYYHHVAVNFPAYIQVPVRFTRLMHPLSFRQVLVSSDYYFFPHCVVLWNSLPCHIVTIQDLDSFKAAVATIQH